MINIKKLVTLIVLPLLLSSSAIAETDRLLNQNSNIQQQNELDKSNKIKDTIILAENILT